MRETWTVFGDEKAREAIDSLCVVKSGRREFCPACHMYLTDEDMWEYKWSSDFSDKNRLCLVCFPTKESIVNYIDRYRWRA